MQPAVGQASPDASAPFLEMGDPVTYDPSLFESGEIEPGSLPRSGPPATPRSSTIPAIGAPPPPRPSPVAPPPPADDEPATIRPAELASAALEPDAAEEEEEEADPYVGTVIDERYVVDDVLGEGGMGRVYLAHHKIIGKKLAIKILHHDLAKDKEAVVRFVREARAASSIGHPHIVDISDFGECPDGSTYFVMEYLDGLTLGEVIEEQAPLKPELIYDIALQLCDGLDAAHRQEIVHRDLKPDNVTLIKQGNQEHFCKLLDFGIAKVSTSASSTKLTMAGAVFGTPHYMSPEQAAGAAVDHRTDIYSLGVILYEMSSGKLPFNADNFMGILTQHMYKAPVPIRALVGAPDCPPGLEAIVLKCLSKKPDARYQTMDELAADLRKAAGGGIPQAVHDLMARSGSFNVPADYFAGPSAVVPATPKGMKRRGLGPRLVAVVGVTVAVAAVLFVVIKDSTTTAQQPTTTVNAKVPPQTPDPLTTTALPKSIDVLLHSKPSGYAWVGDSKVELPANIDVPYGSKLTVRVGAEGFVEQSVELDGSLPKVEVTLTRPATTDESATPAPPRPPVVRPPVKKGGGKSGGAVDGVVDPWDN